MFHSFRKRRPWCVARTAGLGSPRLCYLGPLHRAPRRSVWPLLPGAFSAGLVCPGLASCSPHASMCPAGRGPTTRGRAPRPPAPGALHPRHCTSRPCRSRLWCPSRWFPTLLSPGLLAWEDGVREMLQQRTHWRCLQPRCFSH